MFVRLIPAEADSVAHELLIMDADGGNSDPLNGNSLPDLAAVHCLACPYLISGGVTDASWQPTP